MDTTGFADIYLQLHQKNANYVFDFFKRNVQCIPKGKKVTISYTEDMEIKQKTFTGTGEQDASPTRMLTFLLHYANHTAKRSALNIEEMYTERRKDAVERGLAYDVISTLYFLPESLRDLKNKHVMQVSEQDKNKWNGTFFDSQKTLLSNNSNNLLVGELLDVPKIESMTKF